jgi:hypothetical protein
MCAQSDSNYSLLLMIVGSNSEPLRAGAGAIRTRNFMRMKHSEFDLSAPPVAGWNVPKFK